MKKILSLCAILFLLIGCGQPAEQELAATEAPAETAVITPTDPPPTPEPTAVPATEEIIQAWGDAINAGDVDLALSYLADDASIQLIPPPLPEHDGVFAGKAAIRGWYENIVSVHAQSTIHDLQVNGERVTAVITYTDDSLQAMGVDQIDNAFECLFQDGKLKSYTATITPESLAKFGPPPEAIVMAFADAVADGDLETAVSLFTEDAIVTITPPPSGRAAEYRNTTRIRRWLDGNVTQNFEIERTIQSIEGDTITVTAMMWEDGYGSRQLGIAPLTATEQYTVHGGLISELTITLTDESLAQLEAALTPELADAVEDMVGVWRRGPTPFTNPLSIYSQFRADGTVRTAFEPDGFDNAAKNQGEYWFEGTHYYVKDIAGITPWNMCLQSEETQIGIYEVLMLPDGKLRFVVVEDACSGRVETATTSDWTRVP